MSATWWQGFPARSDEGSGGFWVLKRYCFEPSGNLWFGFVWLAGLGGVWFGLVGLLGFCDNLLGEPSDIIFDLHLSLASLMNSKVSNKF